MDSDRRMALLFFILMIILAITLERMLYSSGEVTLKEKTEITLLEAIEDGLNAQYKALGLYESSSKESNRSFEHCTIISSKGKTVKDIVVEENKVVVTSHIDTKINHTVLAKEGIDADAFLSLWSKKMSESNIVSSHALRIHVHADSSSYVLTCGDSTLFLPKYKKISTIYAGLSNEIEVEPFIRYSWFTVLRNTSIKMVVIGEFILLILLFVCFVYFLRKKIKQNVSSVVDVSQLEIHLANLRYVYDSHEFYVDDRKIQVRPQMVSLILLFLKAPNYTVTKEEIISCLWRQGDSNAGDKLRRALSDLRALFREHSVNLSIESSGDVHFLVTVNC